MTQAMMINAYGNTSPLKAMAVWVRIGSGGITGAWMSIALARTSVDTSKVMFDMAVLSNIDLQRATIDYSLRIIYYALSSTKSKSRISANRYVELFRGKVYFGKRETILKRVFLKIREKSNIIASTPLTQFFSRPISIRGAVYAVIAKNKIDKPLFNSCIKARTHRHFSLYALFDRRSFVKK